MAREIMVVKNDYLFEKYEKETRFYPASAFNFEEIILDKYEYMVRGIAEENFAYKQPITYAFVIDPENKVFIYTRGWAGSNAGDARLHSKIAMWVGGHLEREDEYLENPIRESLIREIEEELNLTHEDILNIEQIGYINNEMDIVSQVHIWFCYVVKVKHTDIQLLDGELDNGEFLPIDEIESMITSWNYEVEGWSKILLEPLKEILQKKQW